MKRAIPLLFAASLPLAAQQPSLTHLAPANGTISERFRRQPLNVHLEAPRDIYELSDGRVLVMDALRLLVADLGTGKTTEIAGAKIGRLYQLAADSGFIANSDGWFFLDGTRTIGMLSPTNPVVATTGRLGTLIQAADERGFLLVDEMPNRRGDSVTAVLINRQTGARTVIGRLRFPVQPQGVFRPVCQQVERAALATDGWVVVLRADPYRIDWRDPSGKWTLGAPIPTPAVPMTPAEQQVYQDWRASERPLKPQDTVPAWPAIACPWTDGYPPIPTPDDKVLVYRVPTTAAPLTRYDVVNRKGEVERQLAMAANEAVLGFGRHSVYIVVTDGQTQTIQRHPWP
jgi:hypothetical protein